MGRKSKVPGLKKIEAVEKYLQGEDSLNHLAEGLDIRWTSIKQWIQTYQSLGPNGYM